MCISWCFNIFHLFIMPSIIRGQGKEGNIETISKEVKTKQEERTFWIRQILGQMNF